MFDVGACSMMFIDFNEFTKNTEGVVKEVCSFVGADPALYKHKELPPGMKVSANSLSCMGLWYLPCPTQLKQTALRVICLCQICTVHESVHHCA